VVIHARTEEADLGLGIGVLGREGPEILDDLALGGARRQVQRPVEPNLLRQLGEQLLDRPDADRLEHRLAVGVGG
jgi:hypothetical protein